MRKCLLTLLLLLCPAFAFGQGARVDSNATKVVQGFLAPIPGATITVCQSTATGTPCSPVVPTSPVTLCTDSTCSVAAANPFLADANGNWGFWALPGTYKVSITATGVTGQLLTVTLPCATGISCLSNPTTAAVVINSPGSLTVSGPATLGNGASMSAFNFSNHNGLTWAGPGSTATIDQAVTGCTTLGVSSQCISHISPGYTGTESTNLFTSSTGYKFYTGSAIITDYRNNQVLGAPMYGITIGGRVGGALNKMGAVNYCHSATDSCAGINSWGVFDGVWPSNGGGLIGGINLAMLHDTVTVGSSLSGVAGTDSEVHMDATAQDNPQFLAESYVGGVMYSRNGATQNIIQADTYEAKNCSDNGVTHTGQFFYCYGFDGDVGGIGLYRNYAFHSSGDFLFEANKRIFGSTTDTAVGVTATESGQTVTMTMASNCAANPTFVAGALVSVSGMSVSGYNNQMVINQSGCVGSSWSAFLPGTNNLAAGSGGTAQTTTPQVVESFGVAGNNIITYQPLSSSGWAWKNQAGSTVETLNANGNHNFTGSLAPLNSNEGLGFAGGNPWSFLVLGNTLSANNFLISPVTPAGPRTLNLWDWGASGLATQQQPATVVLHTAYTNATTTFSTLGDGTRTVSFPVAANVDYTISCKLVYQASATTAGPKIQVTGPASPTAVLVSADGGTNATAYADAAVTAFSTSLTAFGTAGATTTNFTLHVEVGIANGANAGTVALQLAANGAGTLTVAAGSYCRIQ